jgi:hypothetical protein
MVYALYKDSPYRPIQYRITTHSFCSSPYSTNDSWPRKDMTERKKERKIDGWMDG